MKFWPRAKPSRKRFNVDGSFPGETLQPDLIVVNPPGHPNAGKRRLLIQTYPLKQDLDRPVSGSKWKSSPATG